MTTEQLDDLSPDCTAEMPEEWKAIGFSGFFTRHSTLTDWPEEQLATFLSRLPQFIPNSNSVMALREVPGAAVPTVVLVWKDAGAIVASFTKRGTR